MAAHITKTPPNPTDESSPKSGKRKREASKPKLQAIPVQDLHVLRQHLESGAPLTAEHRGSMILVLSTMIFITDAWAAGRHHLNVLIRMLFGPRTETVRPREKKKGSENKKGKGNGGRNGQEDYPGAERIHCPHEKYKEGDTCPECRAGTLEALPPSPRYHWEGSPPLFLRIYLLARLICDSCDAKFTASLPPDVQLKTVDDSTSPPEEKTGRVSGSASACATVAVLFYAMGTALYRLSWLQKLLGMPLSPGSLWPLLEQVGYVVDRIWLSFMKAASQADVFYNDDTRMKILELGGCDSKSTEKKPKASQAAQEVDKPPSTDSPPNVSGQPKRKKERTASRSSIVVAEFFAHVGQRIVLYFSGFQLAGESLDWVLAYRPTGLAKPLQMCDGSTHSLCQFPTEVAHCWAHARRKFFELWDGKDACIGAVLELIAELFELDIKTRSLSPEERLKYLSTHAQGIVDKIKAWLDTTLLQHDPKSNIAKAINYSLSRWEELTKFLRIAGVPLTNNESERGVLHKVIHRKNSRFYKTMNGAQVGDRIMSVIQTCKACSVNPWLYIESLLRYKPAVEAAPDDWLPWNFHIALAAQQAQKKVA